MDDLAIAHAVHRGDRDAFRSLVEREQGAVFRACLRVLGDESEAEDVAQESFVIAYRAISGYRGDGTLRGWLLRIASRQAFRRLSQRRPHDSLDEAANLPGLRDWHDPVLLALAREREVAMRLAVAALPTPYRETIALRFFGELSLEEIAATTRRNLNTVKTHLRRGLQRLRTEIEQDAVA